jgi:Ni/Fe-hydrogenase subunit HybB-like protein
VRGWLFLTLVSGVFLWLAAAAAAGRVTPSARRAGWAALAALWAVTAVILAVRFARGLGAVTAMTDAFPWGVWVGLLQSGVALSAGGFVMAASVHIFHIRRMEPILRPMVLAAFLGYSFVAATLAIEVGRPWALWHPLAMWQHHSIMFEVAWCVTLYMTVLLVEFSPTVFERFGWHAAVKALHAAAIPIVIAGVILSTLHQSSMGSMFLIMPQKVHPLWYSPLLPVFFLLSSMAVGLCVTVVASFYSSRIFHRSLRLDLLDDLGKSAAFLLALYLAVRGVDVVMRGEWRGAFSGGGLAASFWLETAVGAALPAVLLSFPSVRRTPRRLFLACLPALFGVVLNRLNVSWFGIEPYAGASYFPSWMEIAVSLTLASAAVVAFGAAVRWLPVFPPEESPAG